jgi:hypothetical protein
MMTSTLHISASGGNPQTLRFVAEAVQHEIERLEMAVAAANRRLQEFETTYQLASDVFYQSMTAEDLPGDNKDEQYIRWAGEIELRERQRLRLEHLRSVEYEYAV